MLLRESLEQTFVFEQRNLFLVGMIMGRHFRHLSLEDRQKIEIYLHQHIPKKEIARLLNISLSGLYRELARIPKGMPYVAVNAQQDLHEKRAQKNLPGVLERQPELADFLAQELINKQHTPFYIVQQINAGATPFPPHCISLSTLYNQIRSGKIPTSR